MAKLASRSESCSTSVNEMINGSHLYTITGYSLAKGMGPGMYMSSDTFTVGGYDWAIYFYPDGDSAEDDCMYASVFVALASKEAGNVKASYNLTLLDQSGWGKNMVVGIKTCIFNSTSNKWSYQHFLKRSELETSSCLKKDCLIFRCTIGVVMKTRNARPQEFSICVPPSDLGHCFKGFLDSGIASDIMFEIKGETFQAHKQILAARSPVFQAQFFGPVGNPNLHKVVVKDIGPPVFKAILDFIYSDSLPDLHELTESDSSCSSPCSCTILVQHLLAAADLYGLDRLKLLCESKLSKKVTVDTVATTLALADQHNCSQLKSYCLKFVGSLPNFEVMMQSEGYKYLKKSFPALLSELLEFVVTNGGHLCR